MRRIDRFRLATHVTLIILGVIIVIRGAIALAPPTVWLLGIVFIALGGYRLRQYWRFHGGIAP